MRFRFSVSVWIILAASSTQLAAQAADVNPEEKFYKLTRSAPQKYMDGDKVAAAEQANELLVMATSMSRSWNFGNAVHAAHLVLGRIAADAGQMAEAKRHLFESVSSLPYTFESVRSLASEEPNQKLPYKAPAVMDSFGPDMSFALFLLKKGEKVAVLKYLELCGKFWTMGDKDLELWRRQIQAGEIPDFRANLVYFFPKERSKEP